VKIRRVAAVGLALLAGILVAVTSGSGDPFFSSAPAPGDPGAQCASPLSAPPTRPTRRVQCVVAPWFILEVGADHRSLVVEHGPVASCSDFVGSAGAQVRETADGVDVRLVQLLRVSGLADACLRREVIHLPARLNGQHITGEHWTSTSPSASIDYLHRWVADPPYPPEALPLVPRVIGLSISDAQALLAREGFHTRVVGTGRAVLSQLPRRGQPAPGSTRRHPDGGTVTLKS